VAHMKTVALKTLTCKRCGYSWVPRVPVVRQCSRCKSLKWNEPRKAKAVA